MKRATGVVVKVQKSCFFFDPSERKSTRPISSDFRDFFFFLRRQHPMYFLIGWTTIVSHSLWCLQMGCVESTELTEQQRADVSKNMTRLLNKLVKTDSYDKRLRPNYGGAPVEVSVTMFVSSISGISEVEMDFTLDIYLRQTWFDPRLTWKDMPVNEITIDVEYMKHIWVPDTFFPNEKKSFFHTATTHNSFLRINASGKVITSQRLTITAACPMDLHYFPLDSQLCSLEIESYGYSTEDIRLQWMKDGKIPVAVDTTMKKLPTFHLDELDFNETTAQLSTGDYSRLICKFTFIRTIGFYWIQIYQPSMLVVIISWVTFWINRDSAPARVTLGIMTVLTMTTLMSTTNRQMPKVSYVKAVDVYLVVCYIMVFAALLEYAVVSYSNKKKQDINKQKHAATKVANDVSIKVPPQRKNAAASVAPAPRQVHRPNVNPMKTSFWTPPNCTTHPDVVTNAAKNFMMTSRDPRTEPTMPGQLEEIEYHPTVNVRNKRKLKRTASFEERVKLIASNVDKFSRVIFPAIFTLFNIVYWLFYLRASGKM